MCNLRPLRDFCPPPDTRLPLTGNADYAREDTVTWFVASQTGPRHNERSIIAINTPLPTSTAEQQDQLMTATTVGLCIARLARILQRTECEGQRKRTEGVKMAFGGLQSKINVVETDCQAESCRMLRPHGTVQRPVMDVMVNKTNHAM